MLDKILNPSPALKIRLSQICDSYSYDENLTDQLHKMKIIIKCFNIVNEMKYESAVFHGYDSLESCVKVFAEYGIEKKESHFQKCLELLSDRKGNDPLYKRGLSKIADIYENKGYSAAKAIRASLLLCAGIMNDMETKSEIQHSLDCFSAVLNYENIDDFAYLNGGKWIYREGKLFPDYYNLRILAFSEEWKSADNINVIIEAINQLIKLQPIPDIYVKIKGQLIAPGSYLMHDFDNHFTELDDNKKAAWLTRNEYFARIGVFTELCKLEKVKQSIKDKSALIEGMSTIKNNQAFKNWGAYSGVTLEENWTRNERRINDLAFRIGLIEHYSRGYFT